LQKLQELTKAEAQRKGSVLCAQNVQDGMKLALEGEKHISSGSHWLLHKKR
jgi:hypothetical protein